MFPWRMAGGFIKGREGPLLLNLARARLFSSHSGHEEMMTYDMTNCLTKSAGLSDNIVCERTARVGADQCIQRVDEAGESTAGLGASARSARTYYRLVIHRMVVVRNVLTGNECEWTMGHGDS